MPTATYAEGEQIPFYERFYDSIRRSRASGVGAVNILPLSANYDSRGVQIDAAPQPPGKHIRSRRDRSTRIFPRDGDPGACGARSTIAIARASRWS